jgi:butyrate kinase
MIHVPGTFLSRDPDARTLRRRWASLIKRVYEVDPLVCPACGGEMRIIAFIVDPKVVDGILEHLAPGEGQPPQRGPPGPQDLAAVS